MRRDPGLGQTHEIVEAVPEISLYHHSDVLVSLVHVEHQLRGGGRVGSVLYINPHEASPFPGVDDDLLEVPPAEILIEGEPQSGELYREPAFEVVRLEGLDDLLVLLKLLGGVVLALCTLAEDIHGGHAALPAQVPDRFYRLFEALTGYLVAGDLVNYGPRYDGYGIGYRLAYYSHLRRLLEPTKLQADVPLGGESAMTPALDEVYYDPGHH